ncbi:MAG: alginate export family protein [Acidobacteria bacterium]|nr:alginate export family protein [Acidobacteriota bacterium]
MKRLLTSVLLFVAPVWGDGLQLKWLRLGVEYRVRVEGRTAFGYRPGADDAYALSRLRLNIELKPTPWLQMYVQGQDSRVGWIDPARVGPLFKDTIDLRQAYLYVRNGEKGRFGLRVGRQELNFGVQRLVGPLDWTNTARSFDAARLEIGGKNARADIFAASVVRIDPTHFDKRRPGENFHGIYSTFLKAVPESVLEPYLFYKTNPRVAGGSLGLYTAGARLVSKPGSKKLYGLDYSAEAARQWGHSGSSGVGAWAGYGIAGYTLSPVRWTPRFSAEYSYASGDRYPRDGKIGTFDNLYPTNHLFYGLADLVAWQNIHNPRLGLDLKPHKKMKVVVDHHWFWLASRYDHLYNAGLGIAVRAPQGGALHRDIGREADLTCVYTLSPRGSFGAGIGHLFPGRFLKENTPGSSTTFPYVFASFKL